ncbi:hypothetical protein C8D72_3472 [Kushneria indalinina DSM 14324]|uniref:Uncharacterized protein n=1 Tax=Kushneria indalinina DSM 14324 TaxID=1122140 RepID=A0A3D9DRQ7_9GAMM|nr:hypothetical protein C8D72_3472 [Kushneria indalinina DSM 14324]
MADIHEEEIIPPEEPSDQQEEPSDQQEEPSDQQEEPSDQQEEPSDQQEGPSDQSEQTVDRPTTSEVVLALEEQNSLITPEQTVCKSCKKALWYKTKDGLYNYCMVMHTHTYTPKEEEQIKMMDCDGLYLEEEEGEELAPDWEE